MNTDLLDRIYPKDPETGKYIIHLAINNYREVFNELDPAPFKRKDLNTLLRSFLENCSSDIPLKFDIVLRFEVNNEKKDEQTEEKIREGLRNFFLFLIFNQRKHRMKTLRRVLVFTLVSFVSLALGFFLRSLDHNDWFYITVTESFYIGGWVFFWEALAMLTFRNHDKRIKQKEYERMVEAEISFQY
ncbi:MAG: hypothetical protein K9G58_00065 [Bacteroidales bacterium]|nr:hypothetical protein [Bacteroidales bacterium]MCF8388377.1 hypothetical protein [Bacteroidales bacterium]MCF8396534.1 hypothetical protein [Bacteroidales bacterium]